MVLLAYGMSLRAFYSGTFRGSFPPNLENSPQLQKLAKILTPNISKAGTVNNRFSTTLASLADVSYKINKKASIR